MIKVTQKNNWVYKPDSNRWNKRIVSLHGGVGIVIAYTLGLLFVDGFNLPQEHLVMLLLSILMMTVGLIDDIKQLMPTTKLMFNLLTSIIAIYFGFSFHVFYNPILDGLLTIFWITGITNAINMLDNMDGASPGIVFISMSFLVFLCDGFAQGTSDIALILSGVLMGFLVFNFHPAKIFMGDSGSLFLGTITSLLLLQYHNCIPLNTTFMYLPINFMLPVLLISVPIIDTIFVTINRKLNGFPASMGDKGHITHRFSYIFKNDKISILIIYSLQILVGIVSYFQVFEILYGIFAFLVFALVALTLKTNHLVWPSKFK